MGIEFICKKQEVYEEVRRLIQLVHAEPKLLFPIFHIFEVFNKKDGIDDLDDINAVFDIRKYRIGGVVKQEAIVILRAVYQMEDEHLKNIRSQFLEEIISEFGPFSHELNQLPGYQVYREPLIYDDGQLIGQTKARCDVVFHQHDLLPMELIECKANINTFFSKDKPLHQMDAPVRNKMNYLNDLRTYLRAKYKEPYIYFACYSRNIDLQLIENVKYHWGFHYLGFINIDVINEKMLFDYQRG